MKTYVLIYEGFVQYEVVLASFFMKLNGELVTVGVTREQVTSREGYLTVPHLSLAEVDVEEVDLFIIPGGNPDVLMGNEQVKEFLNRLDEKNKWIAAICAAPVHLANAGLLNGRQYTTTLPIAEYPVFETGQFMTTDLVVDGKMITAKANAYVDFAIEIGKRMGIFESEEALRQTVHYFREFNGFVPE